MDRPVHENNYVKSSLDLSVFEMLKLNSSYHLGYDQKQQKRKEHQQQLSLYFSYIVCHI